jgi:hypothetical protein
VISLNFMPKVKVLICSLVNVTLVRFISLEWAVCVLFSMLCLVCVHFISASSFLLSFWYRVSINSYIHELIKF